MARKIDKRTNKQQAKPILKCRVKIAVSKTFYFLEQETFGRTSMPIGGGIHTTLL